MLHSNRKNTCSYRRFVLHFHRSSARTTRFRRLYRNILFLLIQKINEMAQCRRWPTAGYLPLIWLCHKSHFLRTLMKTLLWKFLKNYRSIFSDFSEIFTVFTIIFSELHGYTLKTNAICSTDLEKIRFPLKKKLMFSYNTPTWKKMERIYIYERYMSKCIKYILYHSVCKMRFHARFARGNPYFHTSWHKISYDTRAKNVFLASVVTWLALGSCCKLTLVRKSFIALVSCCTIF